MEVKLLENRKVSGWPVKTIFITPVKRISPQGRSDYHFVDSDGNLIKMDRSFAKGAGKRYNFPSTLDGTAVKTDLSRHIDNRWYDLDPNDLPTHLQVSSKWQNDMSEIVKREKITKQLELEIRFDLDKNALTSTKNLHPSMRFRSKDDVPNFLEVFNITLYDEPNRFDDTTLRGALAQELALVSGKIAESKQEINPSRHDFYVSSENEDTKEKVAKQDIINNAITDLTLLRRNETPFLRYKIAVILGLVKGTVSETVVTDAFNRFITEKSSTQIDNIKKFNEVNELVQQGAQGLDKLHIMYCLKQATNSKVMSVRSGTYIWHSKKGIENLYNLGSKVSSIEKLFLDEYLKYDADSPHENHYGELIKDLKNRSIRIED